MSNNTMRAYDSIILTEDLSEQLPAGTEGSIVDTYAQADDVFVVEFVDQEGHTLDVRDVRADQMTVTLADFLPGEHVALLADLPRHKLLRGQVGTVQERIGIGLYTVAFQDAEGRNVTRLALHAGHMLLLHGLPLEQSA